MASIDSSTQEDDGFSPRNTISFAFSEHRGFVYVGIAILTLWMLGYILDVIAGPYTESTRFVHIVSGLLGTAALVFFLVTLVVGVLWGGFLVVNRLQNQ